MSKNDATPAYRGYRLQALYILSRILNSKGDLIFTPEGIEDLSIAVEGNTTEIIQVKSYDGLVLSNLEPSKENSFFHRVYSFLEEDDNLIVEVANIGTIGPELQNAWSGENKARSSIKTKLKNYGFEDFQIQRFFDRIQIISLDANELMVQVHDKIISVLPGIDPSPSFDLLQKWLYDLSETRSPVTQNTLIEKIQQIGKFLNERTQYHGQWFTNIVPISSSFSADAEYPTLQEEFFAGISARYEHILAGLDFLRPAKMRAIKKGFTKERLVILHGASGQGKSTLAYRYLHENYPEQLRYQIRLVQDRNHALKITSALSGYAEALGTPIIVYYDVSPRDQEWTELLVQLAENPYIQVLVTVREEDFGRANIPYHIQFAEVGLELFIEEAKQLYQRAKNRNVDIAYLSFEDAWDAFGGDGGPLLEFVYLLTQTETLYQRLEEQVKRLKSEVREKKLSQDELEVLKLVSVITAYEGRLHLSTLVAQLQLPDPSTTIQNYEKEYLIRVSDDKQYIEALHPIRSNILAGLLIDPGIESWSTLAEKALSMTLERDWEIFLLSAYVKRSDIFDELISITTNLFPQTWSGLAGVLRCLLWIGLKTYIRKNQQCLENASEIMGKGLSWLIMDLNFAGEFGKGLDNWWETLSDDLIPRDRKEEIKKIRERQTPKNEVFEVAAKWLSSQNSPSKQPQSLQDWQDASELLYWSSRMNLSNEVSSWLLNESIINSLESLDLRNYSNILFALFINNPTRYEEILEIIKKDLELRLAKGYKVYVIEEFEDTLVLHYLTYPEEDQDSNEDEGIKNKIHSETVARIEIARQLFPYFEKYGSRGYGHNIPGLEILSDESIKTGIPSHNFPPQWPIRLNSLSLGIIKNQMRLNTWEEYIENLIQIRQIACNSLELLRKNINHFFQRDKVRNFLEMPPFSTNEWDRCFKLVSDLPMLPSASTDPWGIGQPESDTKSSITLDQDNKNQLSKSRSSILQRKYRTYLTSEREYFSRLKAFYDQAIHVAVINIRCGKEIDGSPQKQVILSELESKGVVLRKQLLSKINLWEAFCNLNSYQSEFHKLFCERAGSDKLTTLEEQERDILEKILWTWFTFVDNPRTSSGKPEKQILRRISNQLRNITKEITGILSTPEFSFGSTQVLNTNLDWDNQSAIWVQLDVNFPLEIHEKIEKLIYSLREKLGMSEYGDQLYSLVKIHLQYVVIVPTFQGKSLDVIGYPLQTTLTLMEEHNIEEKPYLYVPQEIPENVLASINIPVWRLEQICAANDFETNFNLLILKLSLLGEMSEMPEIPDQLEDEFESYIAARSEEITETLQAFLDAKSIMVDFFNSIPEKEVQASDEINNTKQALAELDDILMVEDGRIQIPIAQLVEYAQNLQEVSPGISGIKLIYLSQVIKNLDHI